MNIQIPVYRPSLDGNVKKYVNDCIDSTWISSKGEYIAKFEHEFKKYIDVGYATTVANGTLALHLAMIALGVGEGDEVIVPTFTYIASVNAIRYVNAKPIFVDSEKDSWQLSVADVRKKITPKTKAIMAVHLYGQACNMEDLAALCKEHNIFLIEDCAESLGTKFKDKHVGTFGDISTFSFFGNKTITTGEGGMVVTNDKTLYERAVHFKGQGLAKHRQYWHDVIGYNFRMTNICAAIGLAQLEQIEHFIKRKREIAMMYKAELDGKFVSVHTEQENTVHSFWMNSILTSDSQERDNLRDYLDTKGIETRPTFYPVHTMPMYSEKFEKHPVAEDLGWRGLNLPSFPTLTNDEVLYIIGAIKSFYNNSPR
jgi:perosamine synthetase